MSPVPREFDPLDVQFSDHAHWLARAWAGCLVELHALYDIDRKFSVGFVFSQEVEAEIETSSGYGRVFFLNPCRIEKRATRRRFKKADRGQIAACAAHEFVHAAFEMSWHGEDYANRLTDVMGMMLNHWRRFARHFK